MNLGRQDVRHEKTGIKLKPRFDLAYDSVMRISMNLARQSTAESGNLRSQQRE